MIVKTKFDLGSSVWILVKTYRRCESCGQNLPSQDYGGDAWEVKGPKKIRYISVSRHGQYADDPHAEINAPYYSFEHDKQAEPGLFLHSQPKEGDIFASHDEAIAECNRRNSLLTAESDISHKL